MSDPFPRKRPSGLGRGLSSLLGEVAVEAPVRGAESARGSVQMIPVAGIEPHPGQPRRIFQEEALVELASSIQARGVIQPIVVRPHGHRFQIVAGERRWRAAQRAGLHDVPVTILDVSDREALELAIVENVQRADLNPIEEARGYQALIEEFSYPQATLGEKIGKSRVHVTNTLRLLKLPPVVLKMLEAGMLSAGHGRALLSSGEPERLAELIVERGLSVREAERLAQTPDAAPRSAWTHSGKLR